MNHHLLSYIKNSKGLLTQIYKYTIDKSPFTQMYDNGMFYLFANIMKKAYAKAFNKLKQIARKFPISLAMSVLPFT